MASPLNFLRNTLAALALVLVLAVGSANVARAQHGGHHHHHHHGIGHHHSPLLQSGPTTLRYSPSTSSYYSVPVVSRPIAPLVYSQNYSFYSAPVISTYPPTFTSYRPAFPSSNAFYQTNLLAPYGHMSGYQSSLFAPYVYGNTNYSTTYPYHTPLFFRY